MQTSDLRIGNLVTINDEIVEIESIGPLWVNVELFDFGYGGYVRNKVDISDVRPVRLTETWLKRFGWKERNRGEWHLRGFSYFELSKANGGSDSFCAIHPIQKSQYIRKSHVLFVHQLQNMYHADIEKEMKMEKINALS